VYGAVQIGVTPVASCAHSQIIISEQQQKKDVEMRQ